MSTSINNSNIENLNIQNNTTPIPSKICNKCNQNKPLTEYHKDKTILGGYRNVCKSCRINLSKDYCDKNKQINANKIYTENDVKPCPQCKKLKLYTEFYKCATNPFGLDSYCKDCRNSKVNDSKDKFRKQFSKVLHKAIIDENLCCLKVMGCDPQFLKQWFEFQFDEKMNWNNYGSYFQIDHVKPISLFNIEDENDKRLINHWSNLRPLEKHENISKGNKYNDQIELNHTTKILRFLDHLNKTDPDLCKFATESYSNLY